MQAKLKIGFVGGGNMAAALIGGLVDQLTPGEKIHVVDLNADALERLSREFGVTTSLQIDHAFCQCDVIVLAVKPQQMRDVAVQLQPWVSAQLILSIAAGIRTVDLARWLGGYRCIVRAMPNTPALIGQGVTGLVAAAEVPLSQRDVADAIMSAVGTTVWVEKEALIDAVTAVSGSGPAYVFYFIEAMQQAAIELGLTKEQGLALAKATFVGASQLAAQSSEPVTLLRDRVTSQGGTTHAALMRMEESDVKGAIMHAIKAAAERGKELGDQFGCI